ncbi:kelch domain-containing protein 9 [Suricata suricatta]|uniref:kelch domain-containing protein 9 n=1 Tax=Suricata suricatta TaxID=37032 RepID=UPI0011557BDA|nr:kelch domain-containing protein 9 [Suricata suricatta]
MALAGDPGGSGWTWRPVARDALLARAFHSCTELRGRFYLVGGLPAGGETAPSDDTVVFDPVAGQAVRLAARGGPKTQLRPERPHIRSYKEEACHTASRSGHSAALLRTPGPRPGHQLVLFGGCTSADPEVAGHWGHGKLKEEPPAAPHLMAQLARLVGTGQGSQQGPRGLRHHSCSVVGPFAVLFGGETLTRGRDTVCNDLYIYDIRGSPPLWFRFPCADPGLKRVGHRTCLWNDQLYLVGGFGADGRTPSPQVCILDLFI